MITAKKSKNIVLVNYTGDVFSSFFTALEQAGFTVYHVCINSYEAHYLVSNLCVPKNRVLDVEATREKYNKSMDKCRESLATIELDSRPKIYDIIQMDRVLRHKDNTFALNYIDHVRSEMERFFIENNISLISSGRDSAFQLTSMLVGKKLNIPWVVPTRLRIPLETYGFCTSHETDSFINFRTQNDQDKVWAEKVLNEFFESRQRPALKVAARSFFDVLKLLKPHFKHFVDLLVMSRFNKGNNHSRYTIPKIISMYLSRRVNMAMLNLFKPWSLTGDRPFGIYALHTQPESSIDVAGSFFSDQVALIQFIARSMPVGYELYVKIHPTDVDGKTLSFYRSIKKIHGVRLIHDEITSRELITRASIIFTLTGTIGHEAGLLGKPVVTFAKNYYNGLPTIKYCQDVLELPSLIQKCLSENVDDNLSEKIVNWLAEYKSKVFEGEVNRFFGENPRGLLDKDLLTLQKAYSSLFDELVHKQPESTLLDVSRES